jgi:hypothetical protein
VILPSGAVVDGGCRTFTSTVSIALSAAAATATVVLRGGAGAAAATAGEGWCGSGGSDDCCSVEPVIVPSAELLPRGSRAPLDAVSTGATAAATDFVAALLPWGAMLLLLVLLLLCVEGVADERLCLDRRSSAVDGFSSRPAIPLPSFRLASWPATTKFTSVIMMGERDDVRLPSTYFGDAVLARTFWEEQ